MGLVPLKLLTCHGRRSSSFLVMTYWPDDVLA